MDEQAVKQVKINTDGEEGILYVTASASKAMSLAKKGYPVLGLLNEQNRQDSFAGVQYLAEEDAQSDEQYLERVYRRLSGLPWQILTTPHCIVRETTEADVDAFYKIYEHPSITRYMENLFDDRKEELDYTAQYRKCVYEFYGYGIWTVLLKGTGEVIGRAGLTMREGFEEPELGFVIGVPWQGKGLAREVCEAILHYGEEELEFDTVQAMVQPENKISIALLHALGFEQVSEWWENGVRYLRFLRKKQ